MPSIPNEFTDRTPAAVAWEGSLYIAFKEHNSQHIKLAWTDNPQVEASWYVTDLPMRWPVIGPEQVWTSHGPALSTLAQSLWLAFKGHNNPRIWLVTKTGTAYGTEGCLFDGQTAAETAEGPALAGPIAMHRGNEDNRIWWKFLGSPSGELTIPHESARTDSSPAVAYLPTGLPIVVYRAAPSNDLMFTFQTRDPGGDEWTVPQQILDAETSHRPALAMHDGLLYVAYKSRTSSSIHIASFDNDFWEAHGAVPDLETDRGVTLASLDDALYVVYKASDDNAVSYCRLPLETYGRSVEVAFRPNPNGFAFTNFGEGAPDWDTFRDTFGESEINNEIAEATLGRIFSLGLFGGALFSAFYDVYRNFTNGTYNTGMCSAYAAASLRRYWDGTSASLFTEFPAVTRAADLPDGIRRELTVNFGRLLGVETLTELLAQCRAGILSVGRSLRAVSGDLAAGSGLHSCRIVFFVPSGTVWDAGFFGDLATTHAVVPYKLDYPPRGTADPIRMYVYDCNHPGNNPESDPDGLSYIEFYEQADGEYEFDFFTGDTSSAAQGTLNSANGFTLATMTLDDYLFRDVGLPLELGFIVDLLSSPADLRIHDMYGRMTGYKGGKVHWEIPDSYPLYPSVKGFLLPKGQFRREIWGTGEGPYTFVSLYPDHFNVLLHAEARGGAEPSCDIMTIDATERLISIHTGADSQLYTVALRQYDEGEVRILSLSNVELEQEKPLTLTYSKTLESVEVTYPGAGQTIDVEAFFVTKGDEEPRKVQVQVELEEKLCLQVNYKEMWIES